MAADIATIPLKQVREYDYPPKVSANDRGQFFELPPIAQRYYRSLRGSLSKLNFLLQYGYFRARSRFFEANKYQVKDIQFLISHHRLSDLSACDSTTKIKNMLSEMAGATSTRHRQTILRCEGFRAFDEAAEELLKEQAQYYACQRMGKEEALTALIQFCTDQGVSLPSYHVLNSIVTDGFRFEETRMIQIIAEHLEPQNKQEILNLLGVGSQRATLLSEAKSIDQSVTARSLGKNAKRLDELKRLYRKNYLVFGALDLSDQALTYYSGWIVRAKVSQINQIRDKNKACLYLLAFIKFQYYQRQDHAIESFISLVKKADNRAQKKANELLMEEQAKHAPALSDIVSSQQRLMSFAGEILSIVEDATITHAQRNELVRNLAITTLNIEDDSVSEKTNIASDYLRRMQDKHQYYDELEHLSNALHRAIHRTVKLLEFDKEYSNKSLFSAVQAYQNNKAIPQNFLTKKERSAVTIDGSVRQDLLVGLLFVHMLKGIKGGRLNLLYGFKYRSVQSYLITSDEWKKNKKSILNQAGLLEFSDCDAHLAILKERLHDTVVSVNERIALGNNVYLRPKPDGRFGVNTPALETPTHKYISEQLMKEGNVSVLQVLRDIQHHYPDFISCLSHYSKLNVNKETNAQTAFAALMALGCNIGPSKMGRLSLGINPYELTDFVNWRMSINNLHKANKVLTSAIHEVALARVYKVEDNRLYSSSDGKKVSVSVESLHAKYSFKYFGKESGVAVYSFVAENQSLFHSTVFSATEREATYVLDGLLNNTTSLNRVHATDTHGYTDPLFGLTNFLGITFAPRIKRVHEQGLYDFYAKSYYEEKGYLLVPRSKVDVSTIRENWDDLLRLVCTIKLGVSSVSQLFLRLNSYSSDHTLYKTLKAYGRIIKTQYLMTFYDDLRLRQRIQKQLNLVELSNKFHDAVFWDRKKEFQVGTKDEQEKYTLSRSIIQNAIILWNYLTLSTQLVTVQKEDPEAYDNMVDEIGRGSVLTWRHVDFQGKYDFRRPPKVTTRFPLARIKKLEISSPKRTHEENFQEWDRP